jgi:hypothetical protein
MIIWLLNGNQMVILEFVLYGNYGLRFVGDGNDQILKLLISSNERGLIGNITVLLAPLLLLFTDGFTVYSRIELLKPLPSIGNAHAWSQLINTPPNSLPFLLSLLPVSFSYPKDKLLTPHGHK